MNTVIVAALGELYFSRKGNPFFFSPFPEMEVRKFEFF
jgi:hypothetical protein